MINKNKFVKNRVGGREVNLNLANVCKYTGFFWRLPLTTGVGTTQLKLVFRGEVPSRTCKSKSVSK